MAPFKQRDVVYVYDGTFEGFLCCVFESFMHKELPVSILSEKNTQPSLLDRFNITTDLKNAERVRKSIINEISREALEFLEDALLTALPEKEMKMLDFTRTGYKAGPKILKMLANDSVITLTKAIKQMTHEAQKFMGFVRFSIHDDLLLAKIKPVNFVLYHLAAHFSKRMPDEKFIIYDEKHKMLCAYAKGRYVVSEATDIEMPEADSAEQSYRDLWQMFYDTIAVEGRENPKCRMTLMPKRYWSNLTELQKPSGTKNKKMLTNREEKANGTFALLP